MKKISLLVLVCVIFLCLTSCSLLISKAPAHEHTFSTEWSSNETEHWYAATCEHTNQKSGVSAHSDEGNDGKCDVCGYVMYNLYTVTVTADDVVTLDSASITVKAGTDATFTATVSDKYILAATGAEVVGEPTTENGTKTYTFKVAAVSADASVTVTAEQKVFAYVIASGTVTLTDVAEWRMTYGTVTFTVPGAGTYYVLSSDPSANFGHADEWDTAAVYEVVADAAGEITLDLEYFSYVQADTLDVDYSVIAVDELVLPADKGEGYVIPSFETTVKIVAPKTPGIYWVGSDIESLSWNYTLAYGCFVKVSEGDEYIELVLRVEDATEAVFEFDYTVSIPADVVIVEGDNEIDVLVGYYTKVTFTATKAGSYIIKSTNYSSVGYWDDDFGCIVGYSDYAIADLAEGESISYYISNYAEEDITENINVSYVGNYIVEGENTVLATGNGVPAFIMNVDNYEDRTYKLTVTGNGKLGFTDEDGNVVYVDSKEILVIDGETLNFFVATVDGTDAEVTVSVEVVVYEIYLEIGENTVELAPGVTYTVYSDYIGYHAPYIIEFNGELVYIDSWGEPIESGVEYTWYGSLNLTAIGEETTVTITLIEVAVDEPDELVLGENSIYVPIEDYYPGEVETVFTAPMDGTYIISAADGEENAYVYIDGDYGYEMVELPYEVTLYAYQEITFYVSTGADVTTETEDYIDLVITKASSESDLTLGNNSVYVSIENNFPSDVVVSFIASEAGFYSLAAADGEENAFVVAETDFGSEMLELPYEFYLDEGDIIVFIVSTTADVMTETEDTIDLVLTKIS